MDCIINARNRPYIYWKLTSATTNHETEFYQYNHSTDSLDVKLLHRNPYVSYLRDVYPPIINEHELTNEMLDVIHSYTDSISNECYMKTNLNLISAYFDQIDWIYVNQLRSLIRSINQSNIKPIYYRGLNLSDTEIRYYMSRCHQSYYTNSFLSFTIDRLLIYPGNSILILKTENASEKSKKNLANIWRWSALKDEKEALLAVGTKLKIISVHYYGCKWEIEVEFADEDEDDEF